MKTSLLLAVTALVAGIAASPASVAQPVQEPALDFVGRPARVLCPPLPNGQVIPAVHMDKVIFRIVGDLIVPNPVVQAYLNSLPKNSRLDIKILDDPTTIADLKGKVLTFMGAPNIPFNRDQIVIDDVDYAVVCGVPVAN